MHAPDQRELKMQRHRAKTLSPAASTSSSSTEPVTLTHYRSFSSNVDSGHDITKMEVRVFLICVIQTIIHPITPPESRLAETILAFDLSVITHWEHEIKFNHLMAAGNGTIGEVSFTHQQVFKLDMDAGTGIKTAVAVLTSLFFFLINCVLLSVLNSKHSFYETPRYILFGHMLMNDSVLLLVTTVMYTLALCFLPIPKSICTLLVFISYCTFFNAPLTLALMSLERYVAICFPLRHSTIATPKRTGIAIGIIWFLSSINIIIDIIIALKANPGYLADIAFCTLEKLFIAKWQVDKSQGLDVLYFVSVTVVIIFTYISILITARSISSDKESAKKALKTVMLHLIQLGLCLTSFLYATIERTLYTVIGSTSPLFVNLRYINYIIVLILPRCLSPLIYGMRDEAVWPLFKYILCYRSGKVKPILMAHNGTTEGVDFLHQQRIFFETPRYILFGHMLMNDSMLLLISTVMFMLALCYLQIHRSLCVVLVFVSYFTFRNAPLTLALMSLERYVAICFPLRHSSIATPRRTGIAIGIVWFLNSFLFFIVIIVGLLDDSRYFTDVSFCTLEQLYLAKWQGDTSQGLDVLYFVSVAVVIIFTYISILITARSVSSDKESAKKALKTVMLHLIQLGLCLSSFLFATIEIILYVVIGSTSPLFINLRYLNYLVVLILPRCLSPLIYGMRDEAVWPLFKYFFCYRSGKVKPYVNLMAANNGTAQDVSIIYLQIFKVDLDAGPITKSVVILFTSAFFFFINCVLFFALKSKHTFFETPRYILFGHMLINDSLLLLLTTMMYSLGTYYLQVTRSVCTLLVFISYSTFRNGPLTLALMSLERYVAICFPLRHCTIATPRRTGIALGIVWFLSALNVITDIIIVIIVSPGLFPELLFCTQERLYLYKWQVDKTQGFDVLYFVSVAVVIIFTYISILITARSVSSDKESAKKALKTVMLHLIQLGLCLTSFLYATINKAMYTLTDSSSLFVNLRYLNFLILLMLPRCLSPLIYGMRDEAVWPLFKYYFCYRSGKRRAERDTALDEVYEKL
ncbi:hypothetical protein DNTS_013876 [Danionella cerebrum]|uniref:G-protein coupled receptors family 1 profile domain-containing protein n=1 Tax=Danionella cerebrum TaxID=2873325 RepID=A0A553QBT5_9TELE|nr:hypothetical protein DNTS_013876 [Danionella translucida]